MHKKIVGLTALVDEQRASYWMLPGYMQGILAAGGLPLMLPLSDDPQLISQVVHDCDALLFTGGQDVSPALYAETPRTLCGPPCTPRDTMEAKLFEQALALDRPILGICRGLQLINVLLGGTLYQDLPSEHPSAVCHLQSPPYEHSAHMVTLVPGSPLHQLAGADELAVNSYHHQAICRLSPALLPMARSPDGLIEAAYLPEHSFVWAVQWHPECAFRTQPHCLKLFEALLQACP